VPALLTQHQRHLAHLVHVAAMLQRKPIARLRAAAFARMPTIKMWGRH
jgi:hypothetical protein